jgi:hypothetical protein
MKFSTDLRPLGWAAFFLPLQFYNTLTAIRA